MKTFVGIDLGTTNSAICSYDGVETRIWKSPEQNDVTSSAIYIDKRGNKYVGKRAYDSAPYSPNNAATLFKRLMGTSTPIELSAVNRTMTPEECSAEILKTLFGYLPEEVRNNPNTASVITVPAAFNQMQKTATIRAAEMAGIGQIALMQEPVAAVISVIRAHNLDGMFLIYDLGGGTLDIAIAESIAGRINLLAHGGIAMCGGRDFDRTLIDNVVKPWLMKTFSLPDNFSVDPNYRSLIRLAIWATEKAKIELSSREETVISLTEIEARTRDLDDDEIYLEIPLNRKIFDELIADRIEESIEAVRDILAEAGLTANDLERIVFIGGPTNYKPLRDKVAFELGIPGNTDVNPMTAVAEGASVFAESIDWSSQNRSRKNIREQLVPGGELALTFKYIARTPGSTAKVVARFDGKETEGVEFQIDSIDTGWTSGRLPLKQGTAIDLTLSKFGENSFKVFVFDSLGGPIALEQDRIVITRTAATVEAIPASHSVGVEVLEKLGGRPVIDWLVHAGDPLPQKGRKIFKAAEVLKAGEYKSLNFKLWEGEIEDPITDNRFVGTMKIKGSDFDNGVIYAGADLVCEYEILDDGTIRLEISVPSIRGAFHSDKNFYSRQEGQIDYTSAAALVVEEGGRTLNRINEITKVINDPKLERANEKAMAAVSIDRHGIETEETQEAMEQVYEARRLLAQVKKEHQKEIRQIDLDGVIQFFDKYVRQFARPSEITAFDNLVKTAQRSIDRNSTDFEYQLGELKQKVGGILWRQDWYIVDRFKSLVDSPHLFVDKYRFNALSEKGWQYLRAGDIDNLRQIVAQILMLRIGSAPDNEMSDIANIIRG
jgi:molecular chaperone DnaK